MQGVFQTSLYNFNIIIVNCNITDMDLRITFYVVSLYSTISIIELGYIICDIDC